MPLDPVRKAAVLQQNGYDPAQYDMDDDFNIIPIVKANPTVGSTPLSPQTPGLSQDTPLTTFGKSAAMAAAPTFAGGLGAAGGMALGTPLGPVGMLGGGVLGAIAASTLAQKIQGGILPDELEANVAASQEANPIAGVAGGIAAMPLGGFNPSIKNLATAGKAIPKLLTGMARTPDESAQLLNVGIGAGIGAAQPVGEALVRGEAPDVGDIALNTGIGALFNRPNAIGRRLGFRDPEYDRKLEDAAKLVAKDEPVIETKPAPIDVADVMGAPRSREAFEYKDIEQNKYSGDIKQQPIGTTGAKKEYIYDDPIALSRMEEEGGISANPEAEVERAQRIRIEQLREQLDTTRQEANELRMYQQYERLQANERRIAEMESEIARLGEIKLQAKPEGLPPKIQYSEEGGLKKQPQTAFQKEVQEKFTATGASATPTKRYTELFRKFLGLHRNAEVREDGTIVNTKTGFPVAGQMTFDKAMKKALVSINPNKATLDTLPHETAHVFIDQLRNSTKKADRDLVLKFEKAVEGSPDFQRINAERIAQKMDPWTPEEFIATEQGLEFVNRNLKLSGESDFKTFYRDLWAHIKTRFTSGATPNDFRRILQYKTQYDKPIRTKYIGTQKGYGEVPDFKLYNLEDDITDEKGNVLHPKGSTLGESDLKNLGVKYSEEGSLKRQDERGRSILKHYIGTVREGDISAGTNVTNAMKTNHRDHGFNDGSRWRFLPGDYAAKDYVYWDTQPTPEEKVSVENFLAKNGITTVEGHKSFYDGTQYSEEGALRRAKTVEDARKMLDKDLEDVHHVNMLKREIGTYTNEDESNSLKIAKQYNELSDADNPEQNVLNQDEPALSRRASFAPILTSRYDKVAEKIKSKTADMVTENFHRVAGETDIQAGRIGNRLISATEGLNETSIDRVYRYLHQIDDKGSSAINLSEKEKAVAKAITANLRKYPREEQISLGMEIKQGKEFRTAGMKPEGYIFNVLDSKVADVWSNKPNSVDAKKFDEAFIEHYTKPGRLTPEEAAKTLNLYKKALADNFAQKVEYGPLRKMEGIGLPWDLVEKNFHMAATRYARRAARDLAYFKYIQKDPKMLKALNLKDQYGNYVDESAHPEIENIETYEVTKQALRSILGLDAPKSLTTAAAARSINNTLMGVGTAIRNIAGMPAQIATYVQAKQIPLVAKAIMRLNESRTRAFNNNAVRASFSDYDAAGYYEGSPNPVIRLLNRYSDFARKYQGRNLSDRFEGEFYYSLGELLATDNIARAKLGDKEARRFLDRFGDITSKSVDDLLKAEKVTQDDIERIAKRFVDGARGTYTAEGLPTWAIEGEFAPFTALSRWSIEKANTVWKDVIEPAKQGIYGPLVRYVLGAAGAGFLVEELNEQLSNKRGGEPKLSEVLASGDKGDLLAKAISTMQLAAFAGIVSDGAQLVSSAVRNKGIKYNQPLSFPLYTWLTDTLAGNVSGAANAIKEGEDPFETLAQFVTSLATQSVQSARYLDNNFIHPDEAKRKERFRDYNIWQELTDTDAGGRVAVDTSTAYQNLGAKKFKKEEDIGEATEDAKQLIAKAINKSRNASGYINPEKLKKELTKIKQNSYQTMPSPENFPVSFGEYVTHLKKSLGDEEAANRVMDYIQKREVNKVKSDMVPSL